MRNAMRTIAHAVAGDRCAHRHMYAGACMSIHRALYTILYTVLYVILHSILYVPVCPVRTIDLGIHTAP